MHPDTARWLVSDAAGPALVAAAAEEDPASLAAASRLRALVAPDQAAAALAQVALRRRARGKFGDRSDRLFLTPDGLEQATRAAVAARRAARMAATGARRVVDLGCGLGADALAFTDAGLTVVAVERDEATAILAEANLGLPVVRGTAEEWWPVLRADADAVFCDPARRTASGRSWRLEDLSPPWEFVRALLDGTRPACAKLGPGLPHAAIGPDAEAEWVSEAGAVVECALWAGSGSEPGLRRAVVDGVELASDPGAAPASLAPMGEWLYEPVGAVVRAGLVDRLAGLLRAHRVHADVAYLTADAHLPTPFATAFRVREELPAHERSLREWVRERGVGVLEIKKRGLEVDPAALRRRLKPKGTASATLVLTPTPRGARAYVVERVAGWRDTP